MSATAPHEVLIEEEGHFLFDLWQRVDACVPFPYLYRLSVRPPAGEEAAPFAELGVCVFVYRITSEFVIRLGARRDEIGPGLVVRESYGFRLTPIQGRQGLLTPEQAFARLARHRRVLPRPQSAWHSFRLEQPLGAGVIEPHYVFRPAAGNREFSVGARWGEVREHPLVDAV